jgi:acetylglutamate kinase
MEEPSHLQWQEQARTLAEALPNMRRYAGATFVIKYGGNALAGARGDDSLSLFAADVVLLKQVGINPIVVHGGGPQIGHWLKRLNVESRFVDGLRVTDADTMRVAEMVLAGSVNKDIAAAINEAGGTALGISGRDAGLIRARKFEHPGGDLGLVGEPTEVRAEILETLVQERFIPVVAPIAEGVDVPAYNINADTAAGAIAGALKAQRLFLLTDVPGVLDADKHLVPHLSEERAREMIASGVISGGMIPKVTTCLDALAQGVGGAVILDGRVEHALLLEIFTAGGAGTLIGAA